MGSSLLTKVDTLQASELTELVGSIFRKMCESPDNYVFCLVLVTRLATETTATHSFKDTLETCCQDESALKMFNTQGALSLYMKMLKDLQINLHTDKDILRSCITKIQHGLFELSEDEMRLLAELEDICGSTQFTYHDTPNDSPSKTTVPTAVATAQTQPPTVQSSDKASDNQERETVQCG